MTAEGDTAAPRFERVTVYVDLAAEAQLLPVINACAQRLAADCVVISQRDFATAPASANAPTPASTTVALLQWWQAEEADVYTRDVNNTVHFMNAAELLITDKNSADGAVTYALYRRQMPVLSLAVTHLPARTALHQLLYTHATGSTFEERTRAIQLFLAFPETRGVYAVTTDTSAASGAAAAVVVKVNADGYPIQLPSRVSDSEGSRDSRLLPPPPTLFANVVSELKSSSNAHLDVLRRRNPILPGVLQAFHRFQNRGVVRAMLHRGYRVEVSATSTAESLEWVRRFLALTEPSEVAQAERMAVAASTLEKFESHWLELPLAQLQ